MIGHRGSMVPGGLEENTLAAVLAARAAGAAGSEVDVRRLPDGTLVVQHDAVLGDGDGLLRLAGLLAARPAVGDLILEIKNRPWDPDFDAPVCRTADLLCEALAGDREALAGDREGLIVSSFDWFTLDRIRRLGGPPTALLVAPGIALRAGAAWCAENGAVQLHAHARQVLAEGLRGVTECHDRGVRLVAWPVRSVQEARALQDLGVDRIICDDPADVVRGLRETAELP